MSMNGLAGSVSSFSIITTWTCGFVHRWRAPQSSSIASPRITDYTLVRIRPGATETRLTRELALLTPLNLERLAQLKYDVSTLRTIWRKKLARWASYYAYQLDDAGEFRGRVRHALWSFRLDPTPHRGIFVAKSVAKQYIQRFLEYRPRGVGNCEPHR